MGQSSALLCFALTRAAARAMPALLPEARDLLTAFSYIVIDDEIVDAAMSEPDRGLRSRVTADSVLLLELLDRRQGTAPPADRQDP